MIELKQVSRFFETGAHRIIANDEISFKIEEGEFVAIVGKSGSGKSTLLNLLAGMDRPDAGEILFDGEDISRYDSKQMAKHRLKNIGIVFQSFNLVFSKTATDNVELPLIFAGVSKKERLTKAKDLLTQVGLGHRLQQSANQLSGGEAQRVAIARALVNDPKVILADEPTGNLDSKTTEEILGLLLQLKAQGKTIVMITHDLEIARTVADRIFTIKDGRLTV